MVLLLSAQAGALRTALALRADRLMWEVASGARRRLRRRAREESFRAEGPRDERKRDARLPGWAKCCHQGSRACIRGNCRFLSRHAEVDAGLRRSGYQGVRLRTDSAMD